MERAQLPRQQEIRIGSNQFVHLVTEVLLYIMSWKEETFLFFVAHLPRFLKKSSFKSSSVPFTKCFPFAFVRVPPFFNVFFFSIEVQDFRPKWGLYILDLRQPYVMSL